MAAGFISRRITLVLAVAASLSMGCGEPGKPDAGLPAEAGIDRPTADGARDTGHRDGPVVPVTATEEPSSWKLENGRVFARAHRDGTFEVGRVGMAPFVMRHSEDDPDVVCPLVAGAPRCDSFGPLPVVRPHQSLATDQSLAGVSPEVCVQTHYSGLPAASSAGSPELTPIELRWDVCLAPGSEEVIVRLTTTGEKYGLNLDRLYFPYAPGLTSGGRGYAVVPIWHGLILPVGWITPSPLWTAAENGEALFRTEWDGASAGWTMPFFGVVEEDGRGLYVESRQEADLRWRVIQRAGGVPRVTTGFRSSLDLFSDGGTRELRYLPLAQADHNTVAATYRQRVLASGRHLSLAAKIAKRPGVANLVGGSLIATTTCYYDYHGKNMIHGDSFASIWSKLDAATTASTHPVTRGVLHLDGWGQRGYDNLHPDVLLEASHCVPRPGGTADCGPCDPAKSGWAGFAALAKKLAVQDARHAFLFELHDNYRDFYLDAPSYKNGEDALRRWDGLLWDPEDLWAGGPQQVLCASRALPYLQRNLATLAAHGVNPTAYYLDVFANIGGDQCYGVNLTTHRMTRPESLQHRASLFEELIKRGMAVASEQLVDWAVPYLDHPYWSSYLDQYDPAAPIYFNRSTEYGLNRPVGVAIPLIEMVYHDAVVVPWPILMGERGRVSLDAHLAAGIPNVLIDQLAIPGARREIDRLTRLHTALGTAPLLEHRFGDDRYAAQEARYAGGTVKTDRDRLTVAVTGVAGISSAAVSPEWRWRVLPRVASWQAEVTGKLVVELEWTTADALAQLPAHKIFLHALKGDLIVANGDHTPSTATSTWSPGVPVRSGPVTLTFTSPGTYDLVAGLYDPTAPDLKRLPIVTSRFHDQVRIGRVIVGATGSVKLDTSLDADILLVSLRQTGDRELELMTEWRVDAPLPAGLRVFLHALQGGTIVSNADYDPALPTGEWPYGARRRELRRRMTFEASRIPGTYLLVTGLYAASSGVRQAFSISDAWQQVVLGTLQLEGAPASSGKPVRIDRVRFCPAGVPGCP